MAVRLAKEQCTGCGACEQVCPTKSIRMVADPEGFVYPSVATATCVDCPQCQQVCPGLHPRSAAEPIREFAAYHLEDRVRKASSSGGLFMALAEEVIRRGGVVFGARFDDEGQVVMDRADSLDGLAPLLGSKYVQASVGHSFQQVKEFLSQGRDVLYVGTPCQIAGLKGFLKGACERLLTVDLGCRGVAPPKAWRKYLSEHSCTPVRKISFRDKTKGWRDYQLIITDSEGVHGYSGEANVYMRAYLANLMMRPSCMQCVYKKGASGADLTLSDFWRIQEYIPDFDDGWGVSFVAAYSPKGLDSLPLHRFRWQALPSPSTYRDRNLGLRGSCVGHPKRALFLQRLEGPLSFDELVRKTLYLSKGEIFVRKILHKMKLLICKH